MTAFVELFLSFLYGSLGAQTQVLRFGNKYLYSLSHLKRRKINVSFVKWATYLSQSPFQCTEPWRSATEDTHGLPCGPASSPRLQLAGLGMSCFCCSLTSLFCNLGETRDTFQLEPPFCWLAPWVLVLIRKHHSPRQTLANWTLFQNLLIYIAHGTFCGTCCSVE